MSDRLLLHNLLECTPHSSLRWRALNSDGVFVFGGGADHGSRQSSPVSVFCSGFPVLGDMRYGARYRFDGRNIALH